MIIKVTNQDITLNFRSYGQITIPEGTRIAATENEPNIHFVAEYEWIEIQYQDISSILKSDAETYRIEIPNENISNAMRVRFLYDDSGNCKDIYLAENGRKYCRLWDTRNKKDYTSWYSLTEDWEEPFCPLRTDLLIQVLDNQNKVAYTEQNAKVEEVYLSEKQYPFSWEKPMGDQSLAVYRKSNL